MVLLYLYIFILERQAKAIGTNREKPFSVLGRHHRQGAFHIPIAQSRLVTNKRHPFSLGKLRRLNAEKERSGEESNKTRRRVPQPICNLVSIRIAVRRLGHIAPMVDEEVCSGIIGREKSRHNIPFTTNYPCLVCNDITVSELLSTCSKHAQALPNKAIFRFERDALPVCLALRRKEAKFGFNVLSPLCPVFYREIKRHKYFFLRFP